MTAAELDLGDFGETLLIFGGPYGNLEATRAILAEAEQLEIPAARMICTGDVAAYCADPVATANALRAAGVTTLMGNCEEALGFGGDDCGCGFEDGTACDALADHWYRYCANELDEDCRAWMRTLPGRIHLTIGGARLAVVHGGVGTINRFLFASSGAAFAEEIAATGADGIIAGHSGIPFTGAAAGGRFWHNAGAIGMPANDGTPRVWYSLLIPQIDGLRIEHRALSYDHQAAAQKLRRAGLAEGYAECLASGLWPSLDVLPAPERRNTGKALGEGVFDWRPAAITA
jgi:hypothetical protein